MAEKLTQLRAQLAAAETFIAAVREFRITIHHDSYTIIQGNGIFRVYVNGVGSSEDMYPTAIEAFKAIESKAQAYLDKYDDR